MISFTRGNNSWMDLRDILRDQETFSNSTKSFRGRPWNECTVPHVGHMDESERLILRSDIDNYGLTYMVWSYRTPVGWLRNDGYWRVTQRDYTKTTAKHLGKLRTAVASLRNATVSL